MGNVKSITCSATLRICLVMAGLLVASSRLDAQRLQVDSGAVFSPAWQSQGTTSQRVGAVKNGLDSVPKRRSRLGTAALGFLGGAGVGLVIAHIVNNGKRTGEGKLENYIGIPLALGAFTFMTVYVALGD